MSARADGPPRDPAGPVLTRHAGPVRAAGVRAADLASLRAAVAEAAPGARAVYADLTLGAWRGQWLARQLRAQLGLEPPAHVQTLAPANVTAGPPPDYSDTIGRVVDAETSGDRVVVAALEHARRLLAAAEAGEPVAFVVLLPPSEDAWEREDVLLAGFLAQGLRGSPSRLLLAACGAGAAPAGWSVAWPEGGASSTAASPDHAGAGLLALVPGVVEPAVAQALAGATVPEGCPLSPVPCPLKGCLRLADGSLLVDPALRRADADSAAYERLAEAAGGEGWLRAYALVRRGPRRAELELVCAEASHRFAEGGFGIARRLLESARTAAASDVSRAAVDLQLQGMRIALMDFAAAATAPDPPETIPPGLRGVLLQCKAWGLVMTGKPQEADPRFRGAVELLRGNVPERYYLYLLNISALNRLRLGDADGALALEREIEARLARSTRTDWHLTYVNSLNLARLHRRLGDFDRAERHYRAGFAGTSGVRSPSDLVYLNVCQAQLESERGRPAEAFGAWLRAALHWVAAEVPEALAPRVARAIVGTPAAPPAELLPEAVSRSLLARLDETARVAGLGAAWPGAAEGADPPVFRPAEAVAAETIALAAGVPGWSVLASSEAAAPPYRGPESDRLRGALAAFAERSCPELARAGARSYAVDARGGTELARTAEELLDTAVRRGVRRVVFGGRAAELGEGEIRRLRRKARVRLGEALDHLRPVERGVEAHFKRYRPPFLVTPRGVQLLDWIGAGATVDELLARSAEAGEGEAVLEVLDELERARVVTAAVGADAFA